MDPNKTEPYLALTSVVPFPALANMHFKHFKLTQNLLNGLLDE